MYIYTYIHIYMYTCIHIHRPLWGHRCVRTYCIKRVCTGGDLAVVLSSPGTRHALSGDSSATLRRLSGDSSATLRRLVSDSSATRQRLVNGFRTIPEPPPRPFWSPGWTSGTKNMRSTFRHVFCIDFWCNFGIFWIVKSHIFLQKSVSTASNTIF